MFPHGSCIVESKCEIEVVMKKLLFISNLCFQLGLNALITPNDPDKNYEWWESSLTAEDTRPIEQQTEVQIQINSLTNQIEDLKKEIRALRLKEMHFEVDSEKYIKSDWNAYSQELIKAEKANNEAELLEQKLKVLEEQKRELQNSLRKP